MLAHESRVVAQQESSRQTIRLIREIEAHKLTDLQLQKAKEQAAEKGISFNCHLHSRLPDLVITDEKRLRQILINLLSNALKYTATGNVDFHVRYRNQVAEFSVVDTGVGIHADDLKRILDPFERVRGPDVPNVQGTGLGLTIVKLLTEVMGGELKITSTPGVGSCFTVSLMFSWIENPAVAVFPSRFISGYPGPRRVVLVVDDEPIHRGPMFDLLNPIGFTTIEARDARSCLGVLRDVRPDIFLLDVSMPGIDGLELARVEEAARPCSDSRDIHDWPQ